MKIPGQESQVTSPRSFSRSEDTVSFFSLPGRSCWPDAPRGLQREWRGVGMGQSSVALPGGFHVPRPRRSFRTHELCKGAMLPLDKETRSPGSPRRGGLGFHACGCCGPSGFPVAHQPRALGVDLVTADRRPCGSRRFWSLFQETRWVLINAEMAHSLPLFIPDWQPESHVGYSQGAYPRKLPCAFIARAA